MNFKLASTSALSRFSEFLRITADVENERQLLDISKVRWTDFGLAARRKNKLFELCGDTFVIGGISGGLLSILYLGNSSSSEEQQSLKATLSAAYSSLGGGGKVDIGITNEMQRLQKTGRLQFSLLREGPNEGIADLTIAAQIEYALTYNTKVKNKPWITGYIVASYDAVPDTPDLKIPTVPDMDMRARVAQSHYQRIAGLSYMIKKNSTPGTTEFGAFDLDRAIRERNELQSKLERYQKEVQKCLEQKISTPSKNCQASLDGTYVRDVPDRPFITTFDPQNPASIRVAETVGVNPIIVENRGNWNACRGGNCPTPPNHPRNTWQFINRKSGKDFVQQFKVPMKLPPDAIAYFKVEDIPLHDNDPDSNDPPRIFRYVPLYEDDYEYPEKWDRKQW